jgi:hypothetical protein
MLVSDGFEEYDGFYFDDISITEILPGGLSVNENITDGFVMNVYPNPASDQVTFSTTLKSNGRLFITDGAGRLIHAENISSGINRIDFSLLNLENGIYFYTLKAEDGSILRGKFSVLK